MSPTFIELDDNLINLNNIIYITETAYNMTKIVFVDRSSMVINLKYYEVKDILSKYMITED